MDEKPEQGLLASLHALGQTLVGIVGTRAELAVLELREEGERKKEMLVLALVASLFLALGLLLAAFLVVVVFWDTHRLAAISAVTALYLGVAFLAYLRLRAQSLASPAPFEATLRELAADRDALRGQGE